MTKRSSVLILSGFLTLPFLLAGCAAGPDFKAPKTIVDSAFANGSQTNLSSEQVTADWWHAFNDPVLNRLVDRAVAENHDLRIATARVREARASHDQSRWDFFPSPRAEAGWQKTTSAKDSIFMPTTREQRELDLFTTGFDATWELDVFGRVRRANEAARADWLGTYMQRRDVLVSLEAEVARNYFELRGTQNRLEVARKNATNQEETLKLTLSKVQAGRGTELDSARARAQLDATKAAIPPLESSILKSIHRLSVLSGQQPNALTAELSKPAPLPALPKQVNISSPADLLRRRPDIRTAEYALHSATARIGVATADLFPRVTVNGRIGLSSSDFANLTKSGSDYYGFGPNISWAALDIGHVRARIRSSKAKAEEALAVYEKTVLKALEETENALVDFGHSESRRDYLESSTSAAEQAFKLARQRYEGGISDFLTVLDAQRTQLEEQDQLAQSQMATATSLVAVYKSLGGGWQIGSTNAPATNETASSSGDVPANTAK